MLEVAATPSFYLDGRHDRRYMDVCIKLALEMGPYGHYTLLRRFHVMESNFRRGDQGNVMFPRWCNAFKAAWEAAEALLGDDVDPESLHSTHSTSVPTHARVVAQRPSFRRYSQQIFAKIARCEALHADAFAAEATATVDVVDDDDDADAEEGDPEGEEAEQIAETSASFSIEVDNVDAADMQCALRALAEAAQAVLVRGLQVVRRQISVAVEDDRVVLDVACRDAVGASRLRRANLVVHGLHEAFHRAACGDLAATITSAQVRDNQIFVQLSGLLHGDVAHRVGVALVDGFGRFRSKECLHRFIGQTQIRSEVDAHRHGRVSRRSCSLGALGTVVGRQT